MKIFITTFTLFLIFSFNLSAQYDMSRINSPYDTAFVHLEVGPNDVVWAASWGGGVYRSTDNGNNFTQVNNGLTNLNINRLDYNDGVLLAATYGSVFKSTNEGDDWEQINTGLFNDKVTDVAALNSSTFFCVTKGNGVFRTNDAGSNWEEVNNGLNFQDMRLVFVTPNNNVIISTNGEGLYRSDNGGETWEYSGNQLYNDYVTELKVSPKGKIWAATAGDGLFISDDDGRSWGPFKTDGLLDHNIETFEFYEEQNVIYPVVGSRMWGIWWYDPQNLVEEFDHSNQFEQSANSIIKLSNGRYLAAIVNEGIMSSTDDGKTWEIAYNLDNKTNDFKFNMRPCPFCVFLNNVSVSQGNGRFIPI